MTNETAGDDPRWQMQTCRVLEEVRMERDRQRVDKGYTRTRDDGYAPGALCRAGCAHAYGAAMELEGRKPTRSYLRFLWPWDMAAFKAHPARRALIVACALIVAEIEKLDRGAERSKS
ncbi:MAG: hypothetical protein BroJett013_30360 [Alphaproteobacteria bacterium]|nr:MAG: hypothetical protein BroJett013_30360 [Alphaproteobacteria bacterium]